MVEHSPCCRRAFLKGLELDLHVQKTSTLHGKKSGIMDCWQTRAGRSLQQSEAISWATRSHLLIPLLPISSPTLQHSCLPSQTCFLRALVLPLHRASSTLTHTCSPHPPTQLSIATKLGNYAHFSPENPCQALPAATSLTDVLLKHSLSFSHSGSLGKYLTPHAKLWVLSVGGKGITKFSLGHPQLRGADFWTLQGLSYGWVIVFLCCFPWSQGNSNLLSCKKPAQCQLQERAWLNIRYEGMRDSWHFPGRWIHYTFWYLFKSALFQFISMRYKLPLSFSI